MNFEDLKEKVRDACDIVDVIERNGTALKRAGNLLQGLCPFHPDQKTPSLTVYPETQSWYCFGCSKGGDVFDFIMNVHSCSFMDALSELAREAGIDTGDFSGDQNKKYAKKRLQEDILSAAAEYYHENLTEEVAGYLIKDRGLTRETIKLYKIGYAPEQTIESAKLEDFLKTRGFSKEQAVEASVLYPDGRKYFSGSITFPNWHYGKVVYITGRGYPEKSHKKPLKEKLSLNHLFLESMSCSEQVIITEGEIDTYTLKQAGFNACGIYGTSGFRKEWVAKFKNIERVYISLDGDNPGIKTALEIGELLGSRARIVSFPDVTRLDENKIKDWNELLTIEYKGDIKAFQNEFRGLLTQAKTVLEYKIKRIPENIPQREIPKALEPIIAELTSLGEIELEFYIDVIINHLKGNLKLSRSAIKNEIKRSSTGSSNETNNNIEIIDNKYPMVSPSQDFVNGIGYLAIPVTIKLSANPKDYRDSKIIQAPYIVSSRREFFRFDEQEMVENMGIIPKSKPVILGNSRWSVDYIRHFQRNEFKDDPGHVYNIIKTMLDIYLDFKVPGTAEIIALWIVGTYIYQIFETYPYISYSAERGSGKTKTLSLAEKLCFNAVFSNNISTSLMFRIIEGSSCTLLIDEAEKLKDPKLNQDFRLLLNAGYKRGGRVHRSKPDTFEPQSFDVYSPKMIANIKGLEEVLESRCIQFTMLRTKDIDKANTIISESCEDWAYIRHLLYSFALLNFSKIRDNYLQNSNIRNIRAISGREGELWQPILAIACFFDEFGYRGLFEQTMEMAVEKGEEAKSTGLDEWTNAMLLGLKESTFSCEEGISNKNIREKMSVYLGDEGATPSCHWIGRKLKSLGLIESSERLANGYRYVIRHASVTDVMERYGV